jgi:hypothetical protein
MLLVNLSKGRIGEDASAPLGSLLVSPMQIAAMSRSDVPDADRPDFYLYVDEFQNSATDSFATILSEARKYRLNLTRVWPSGAAAREFRRPRTARRRAANRRGS